MLSLYGARGKALWQEMLLGHFKGLKCSLKTRNLTILAAFSSKKSIKYNVYIKQPLQKKTKY